MKDLNLTATVKKVTGTSFMSWGNPNRFDDWETPAKVLFVELSDEDKRQGYCLEQLTIWMESYEVNTGTVPSVEGTALAGLKSGSKIKIHGPLYRADLAYGWAEHPLKEEPEEVHGVPGPIRVSAHEEPFPTSEVRRMPKLSVKTAKQANASLKEDPITKLSD